MNVQEIRTHIQDLLAEGTIPQANATKALEYLNERNINGAIAQIINFI